MGHINCSSCGNQIPVQAKVCTKCGQPLESNQLQIEEEKRNILAFASLVKKPTATLKVVIAILLLAAIGTTIFFFLNEKYVPVAKPASNEVKKVDEVENNEETAGNSGVDSSTNEEPDIPFVEEFVVNQRGTNEEPEIPFVEELVVNERGNSIGNIANYGFAAQQGDWIYYTSHDGNVGLYKMKNDGSNVVRITTDRAMFINVVGNWIYYTNLSDNCNLYKVRTDGKHRSMIGGDNGSYNFVTVIGDWIYYILDRHSSIYRMRTDGSNLSIISSEELRVSDLYVGGDDWLYFVEPYFDEDFLEGRSFDTIYKICRIRIDGSYYTEIFRITVPFPDEEFILNIADGWIYYFDEGICMIKTDGNKYERLSNKGGIHFNIAGDWIYYDSREDGLYKIRKDTSGRTKLTSLKDAWGLNIVGDWIFYQEISYDEQDRPTTLQCRIKKDGSDRQLIN